MNLPRIDPANSLLGTAELSGDADTPLIVEIFRLGERAGVADDIPRLRRKDLHHGR